MMLKSFPWRWAWLLPAGVVPFVLDSPYFMGQLVIMWIWATVVCQWNLVFGVAGIFSLAQLAVFAVGAYAAAMTGLYLGWSFWLAMLVGAAASVVFSLLIGLACLRLRGAYVALLTIAVAQVLYLVITTDTSCVLQNAFTCASLTGGPRGLTDFGDFGFSSLLGYRWRMHGHYFLAMLIFSAAMVFSSHVMNGPMGLAFRALRDNEAYARSRGVQLFKTQLKVFTVSAVFTGLAGAFYAGYFRVVGANILSTNQLLFVLSMLILGGLGRPWGAFMGVIALMIIDEGLKELVDWRLGGLGLTLILGTLLLPEGIAGAWEQLRLHMKARRALGATQ